MSKAANAGKSKRFWIVCYLVSFLISFGTLAFQSLNSTFSSPNLKADFGLALFFSPFTCFIGAFVYEAIEDPVRWVINRLKSIRSKD